MKPSIKRLLLFPNASLDAPPPPPPPPPAGFPFVAEFAGVDALALVEPPCFFCATGKALVIEEERIAKEAIVNKMVDSCIQLVAFAE